LCIFFILHQFTVQSAKVFLKFELSRFQHFFFIIEILECSNDVSNDDDNQRAMAFFFRAQQYRKTAETFTDLERAQRDYLSAKVFFKFSVLMFVFVLRN